MKVIEGTPDEIYAFYMKQKYPTAIPVEEPEEDDKDDAREFLRDNAHWSASKRQWIPMKEMDACYIMNVIRKTLREKPSNVDVLGNEEFRSLIVVLGDKMVEEE